MTKVSVIGMGYIGLPTASIFANQGFDVVGVDVNPKVVSTLSQGDIHIQEPGLHTLVASAIGSGKLRVKTIPEESDVFIIAVPTPFQKRDGKIPSADLQYVRDGVDSILPYVKEGDLVILESTVPPGTTYNDVYLRIQNERHFKNLYVAHCPERVLPGHILKELIENDRIIGGVDEASSLKAKEFYGAIVEGNIHLTDATTAEMSKLMENAYRDVNIALANELALISEHLGIDAREVIKLANFHPRVNLHQPGPGVGGHCISVDPWFVVEKDPERSKLLRMAREINDGMPHHVVKEIIELVSGITNPKIALLGLTYKPDVDDIRESPAIDVFTGLKERGYNCLAFDPFVDDESLSSKRLEDALVDADLAVILVGHSEFKALNANVFNVNMRRAHLFDTVALFNDRQLGSIGYKRLGKGRK